MERVQTSGYRSPGADGPAPPVVLLCGGTGDYTAESRTAAPRPTLSSADRPLFVHVMRQFADYGSTEFVLALSGPGKQQARECVLDLELRDVNVTIRLGGDRTVRILGGGQPAAEWTVTCADTGELAGSTARLRYAASFVRRWPIIVAQGKGLADVDVAGLVRFHQSHGRMATVAVAVPPVRPGRVTLAGDHRVLGFGDAPDAPPDPVSTGLFVLEEAVVARYLQSGAGMALEAEPVHEMIADGELMAYRHNGYWQLPESGEDAAAVRRSWRPARIWPAQSRADVRAVNGTPRDRGDAGRLSALTKREMQVATLVGKCLTNRAIARQLSVAEKTVEMHLSNVFGKLAVSSRTELAALMIRTQRA